MPFEDPRFQDPHTKTFPENISSLLGLVEALKRRKDKASHALAKSLEKVAGNHMDDHFPDW